MSAPASSNANLYLLHANGVPLTASGKVLHLELGDGDGMFTSRLIDR